MSTGGSITWLRGALHLRRFVIDAASEPLWHCLPGRPPVAFPIGLPVSQAIIMMVCGSSLHSRDCLCESHSHAELCTSSFSIPGINCFAVNTYLHFQAGEAAQVCC